MKKEWIKRMLLGGCAAVAGTLVLILLLNFVVNSITWGGGTPDYSDIQLTFDRCAARFGSAGAAVAMELAAVFALGAAIGLSTLPFSETWTALLPLSLLHFAVTGALAMVVGWSYLWFGMGPLPVLTLYLVIYLGIWLVRWLVWYAELRAIRRRLGLAGKERKQ